MYLIIDKFSFHFQNLLEPEDPTPYDIVSIIHKTSFLRNQPTGFSNFVNKFISEFYTLIYEENIPRITSELQECLHPSAQIDIGVWFVYKDYTILIIYGAELKPYRLPTFLTPRIFALKVLRQRFNSDYVHFSSNNQATSFKFPIPVGPFTVKSKVTVKLIDEMLVCFNFEEYMACQYDPCQIISNKVKS